MHKHNIQRLKGSQPNIWQANKQHTINNRLGRHLPIDIVFAKCMRQNKNSENLLLFHKLVGSRAHSAKPNTDTASCLLQLYLNLDLDLYFYFYFRAVGPFWQQALIITTIVPTIIILCTVFQLYAKHRKCVSSYRRASQTPESMPQRLVGISAKTRKGPATKRQGRKETAEVH